MTLHPALARLGSTLLLVVALVGAALTAPGSLALAAPAAPSAEQATRPAVYWSLGEAVTKPRRVFTAYSSSPYLKGLRWKHWGEREALGTGTWVSDCASCSPPKRRAAKVVLTGFVTCDQDPTVRSYRKAVVTVSRPDQGSTDTTYRIFAGCP